MPHRVNEFRTVMATLVSAKLPMQIAKAAAAVDIDSNAEYVRVAVCERIARDLGMDFEELHAQQPPPRGRNPLFQKAQ